MANEFNVHKGQIEIEVDGVTVILRWEEDFRNGAQMYLESQGKTWNRTNWAKSATVDRKFLIERMKEPRYPPSIDEYFGWTHEFTEKVVKTLENEINTLVDPTE